METEQAAPSKVNPPKLKHVEDKDPSKIEVSWSVDESNLNGVVKTFKIHRNDSEAQTIPNDQFSFVDVGLMVCFYIMLSLILLVQMI